MEREFVRHKALDAVGDLYTLGAPMIGRFETVLRRPRPEQPALLRAPGAPPPLGASAPSRQEMAQAV